MASASRKVEVSAPGKVILHGEHAVMFGKTALAGSLGLRTTTTVQEEEADEPALQLLLPDVRLEASMPLERVARHLFAERGAGAAWDEPRSVPHERVLRAVDACVAEHERAAELSGVQRDAVRALLYLVAGVLGEGAARRGVRVHVHSALAVGAGSGSSASFAVSAAGALLQLRRLRAGTRADAFDARDRDLISAWAFNCERIMHGAPSGVDNATCTFGGLVSFRQGEAPRVLATGARLRVLLVDTRVARQTRALAERVAARRARLPLAVDCVVDACGHVADAAAQILEQLPGDGGGDGEIHAQYRRLAELWDMNHCLLAALGVSHSALEHVRQRAAERGLTAKLTGAGGGGNAIVLLPPSAAEATVRALSYELQGAGYRITNTLLGGEGVLLHRT